MTEERSTDQGKQESVIKGKLYLGHYVLKIVTACF